ncbi:MAG TPA: hypothetical protein VF069_29585 [Streptosporangiaceae bacterium]
MIEEIRRIPGSALDRTAYHTALRRDTERLSSPVWKLERSQFFSEPDDDRSWRAFVAGDWEGTLAAFENDRAVARAEGQQYASQGSELRRLRIVECPVSPYLQWEMQWFRIIAEEGAVIRVLAAEHVRELEQTAPLPELVVTEHALYQVRYDEGWRALGARRIDDLNVRQATLTEISRLWEKAEPFSSYFEREIAPLPPPVLLSK